MVKDGAIFFDDFIREMFIKMKEIYKDWVLMPLGTTMEHIMKFFVIKYAYLKIYSVDKSLKNIILICSLLYELYEKHISCSEPKI